jgi:hypothetical protein
MKAAEADKLGEHLMALLQLGRIAQAHDLLDPVLAQRTPFAMLDRIGSAVGTSPPDAVNTFLEQIAADRSEGGWVIIGSALRAQLGQDQASTLARCRDYIVAAGVWYGADILGDRVPGPALVADFGPALTLLGPWREDANRWVRRAVGVSAHYWAKRTRGGELAQAQGLLTFLEPMYEEWNMDAAKGVGWGLKTLGRYYPLLLAEWLARQSGRRHRALMQRKALTHLSPELRDRALHGGGPAP